MTARRLVFVPTAGDAPPTDPDATVVVLDTSWTPLPGGRPDLVPVRPAMSSVIARRDLFRESLERLDAWAAAADIDGALLADGVAWWYRLRPFVWYALHEAILWARVLGELDRDVPARELVLPAGRPVLEATARAVASARGSSVGTPAEATADGAAGRPAAARVTETASSRPPPRPRNPLVRYAARLRRLIARETTPKGRPPTAEDPRRRLLDERVRAMAGRPGAVLVVAHPKVFQVLDAESTRVADPQLVAVLDRLAGDGVPTIVVGLELDHRVDADWAAITADEALLPAAYINARWRQPEDRVVDSGDVAARVASTAAPLDVDGVDLAPVVLDVVAQYLPAWLDSQRRVTRYAERLLRELRPRAMFLNHEGIRTPWLAAARRVGLPVVAIQHGVIYPTHPVYRHPRLATIALPDVTCVYGPEEREVLLEHGSYLPDEVVVTGSPRLDIDRDVPRDADNLAAQRRAVRRELGVRHGDALLVVSTANLWIVRDVHVVDMVARLLDGPLPRVHVVVKQHPGEADEGPFPGLLAGLAAAGGYAAPPVTVVKDIDLYRLLRAADAHLGLHSTVLTDAVVAGTPNLIAAGQAFKDLLGYVDAGVATPVRDARELRAALADPRPPSAEARAAFLARHFREGDAAGRIVEVVHRAVARAGDRGTT